MIGQRARPFRKNADTVDQLRRVTWIRATDVASANNIKREETRLSTLMKRLIDNVAKETDTKSVEKRHHEAVVRVRETRKMASVMARNGDLMQKMEGTHRLAEAVTVMMIVTMILVADHIVSHRVAVTMNQIVANHDEVAIQVQMEVMLAVADENDAKVQKDK